MEDKMNDQKLKEIAKNIIKAAGLDQEEKFGSVVLVLMMISIILSCIRVIQECNKNKLVASDKNAKSVFYGDQVKTLSANRNWFTKMRIKKIIRKELSPEDYRKYSNQIMEAILNYGENAKEEEIYTLVEAANV
jgi:hypothetical protein